MSLSGQRLLWQWSWLNGELAERGLIQTVGCRILGRAIHDNSWFSFGKCNSQCFSLQVPTELLLYTLKSRAGPEMIS